MIEIETEEGSFFAAVAPTEIEQGPMWEAKVMKQKDQTRLAKLLSNRFGPRTDLTQPQKFHPNTNITPTLPPQPTHDVTMQRKGKHDCTMQSKATVTTGPTETALNVTGTPIDLLEIYASPNSRLTDQVRKLGGVAERYSREQGDLDTNQGKTELLDFISREKPRHVWCSAPCTAWSQWQRMAKTRGKDAERRLEVKQREARRQLEFVAKVAKAQTGEGRHFHLEQPKEAGSWQENALDGVLKHTVLSEFDQCRLGLKDPELGMPLKKATRVATNSRRMLAALDGRKCDQGHEHRPIEGSVRQGKMGGTVKLSRWAERYPPAMATKIARAVMISNAEDEELAYPAVAEGQGTLHGMTMDEIEEEASRETEAQERRIRVGEPLGEEQDVYRDARKERWIRVFSQIASSVPRLGSRRWSSGTVPAAVKNLVDDMEVTSMVACRMAKNARTPYEHQEKEWSKWRRSIVWRPGCDPPDVEEGETENWYTMRLRRQASRVHTENGDILLTVFGRRTSVEPPIGFPGRPQRGGRPNGRALGARGSTEDPAPPGSEGPRGLQRIPHRQGAKGRWHKGRCSLEAKEQTI